MNNKILLTKIKFKLFEKFNENVLGKIRNKKLITNDFTIISNNCWSGWVYRCFNLKYMSPTIGLFIMPKDYLKFVKNLNYYINECELKFINYKESKYYDYWIDRDKRFGTYPIGLLEDVEIHFLHYKSDEEAYIKWNRRKERINFNKLVIKFNDQNGATSEDIQQFMKLNFRNKICFVSKKYLYIDGYNGLFFIKEFENEKEVIDDKWFCNKYMNLLSYFNNLK